MSPSRAKSIETELAQLLSMNEICNDDNDNDEDRGLDSKSNHTDNKSVKSNKSKSSNARSRSGRSSRNKEGQKHPSSTSTGINNNDSTNSFAEEEEDDSKSNSNSSNNNNNNRIPLVRTKSGSARSRDSRKIRYNSNETIEERDGDEKSVPSRESARSRKSNDSKDSDKCPNDSNSNSNSKSTTTTTVEEEKSSKSRRSRRTSKYQEDDVVPESAQERDKDARTTRRSGLRDSARSSRRRIHDGNNNKKIDNTGTTLFSKSPLSSPRDPISSRRRKVVKALDEKDEIPDEFEDWSSEEEEMIPMNDDNNNNNDDDVATKPRELRRGINRSHSTLDRRGGQQRTRRGGLMRSMSQDVTLTQGTRAQLDENGKYDDGESHENELNGNNNNDNNNNNNNSRRLRSELPSRRLSRTASTKFASVGMAMGDPSRRAPPSRSQSQCIISRESVLNSSRHGKDPPRRSQSNDFSSFLRQGTTMQQQQRPSMRISSVQQSVDSFGKFGMEHDDNDDNPFEVINKGLYDSKSSREITDDIFDDPNNDNNNNEDVHSSSDRRRNMTASKSVGLLQLKASSKDTMRVSARTKKIVVMTDEEEKQSIQDAKIVRDKQRRTEYNNPIAAATSSAGRIRMSRRPSHRQVKRQNSSRLAGSSLGESLH